MTETNQTSISETSSLGQQLKQAREQLNLSIDEVAQKTNLKKSHIESLENDIFILQSVAPTFVRGYVRSYLRFLRLPEELMNSVNYGEVKIPKEVSKPASSKVVQKSQSAWVKYLTIFVLLAAIGMTLLWWWQDYQKEQENRDQFVNNAIPVETASQTANQVELIQQNAPQAVENSANVATTTPAESQVAEQNQPAVEQVAVQTSESTTEAKPQTDALANNVLNSTAIETPAVENSENTATVEQVAVGNDELRIEITGKESWITVRGNKSKKSLAEKLYNNGEVLTFNDNEQYRLTIGAPANVKVYYKGQLVPLKIDGRVARIKLPLAQ